MLLRAQLKAQPDSIADMLQDGLSHHHAGRLSEAVTIYLSILHAAPDNADSHHLVGLAFDQSGYPEAAEPYIRRALAQDPANGLYHNSLATVLNQLGQLDGAIEHYHIAARLRPDAAQIPCNLATVLYAAGETTAALAAYRMAAALDPGLGDIWYNMGAPLTQLSRFTTAASLYRRAWQLNPAFADAGFNLGNMLVKLRRLEEAVTAFRAALAVRGDHAEGHNNLGVVLQELSRLEEAETAYLFALHVDPLYAEAHYNLGCLYLAENRCQLAIQCFHYALELRPTYGEARWALVMAQLPILYTETDEIAACRRAYRQELQALADLVTRGGNPAMQSALALSAGTVQPFFLPYQGENDSDLQSLYGTAACRLLARHYPSVMPVARPAPGEKIRVGIVSGFFYEHTVWRLFLESWLKHLDRRRFSVFAYHTGIKRDNYTDQAAQFCDRFVEGGRSGAEWRSTILADAPHIILYPEVGMDPMTGHLAAQRLAPVQCVAWGHPNTTGLPTMDYFLSSALMEPEGADSLYTEKLVRLPNLGTCYEVPYTAQEPHAEVDRMAGPIRYWSGQAIYKYLPQYDHVFARIALAAGHCRFFFIEFAKSKSVTRQFIARMDKAFADYGLNAADYCVFLPPMLQEAFIGAIRQCDIQLDTIGWSGGKSTLDSLSHDAPIVTFPSQKMRDRHTAAILQRIGVTDTVATSIDDYVRIATELAHDQDWRSDLRRRMSENRHLAFDDLSCIRALEDFITTAIAG